MFDAAGDAVYLSLNQGTTNYNGADFVRKPEPVLAGRVAWGRGVVADWLASREDFVAPALGDRRAGLGEGYELGNIAAVRYARSAVPTDDVLLADAREFARALGALYRERARAPIPFESPEVEAVEDAAAEAAGKPRPPRTPGYRVSAAERKVIEQHAVRMATDFYRAQGWKVREFGKPFDLRLRRDDEEVTVEVKGTTSDGLGLSLTEGEVRHHERVYPKNALIVVRNILLERGDPPKVSGGTLHEVQPWLIDPGDVRPVSYAYAVPPESYLDQL